MNDHYVYVRINDEDGDVAATLRIGFPQSSKPEVPENELRTALAADLDVPVERIQIISEEQFLALNEV